MLAVELPLFPGSADHHHALTISLRYLVDGNRERRPSWSISSGAFLEDGRVSSGWLGRQGSAGVRSRSGRAGLQHKENIVANRCERVDLCRRFQFSIERVCGRRRPGQGTLDAVLRSDHRRRALRPIETHRLGPATVSVHDYGNVARYTIRSTSERHMSSGASAKA